MAALISILLTAGFVIFLVVVAVLLTAYKQHNSASDSAQKARE